MNKLLSKFRQDVSGICFFASATFVAAALLSYNPNDPSLNAIGHSLKVANYCGILGSFLADALFQLFGFVSWMFPLFLARFGYLCFQGEILSLKNLRVVWASLLLMSLSCLIALYFPETKTYNQHIYLSGLIGLGLTKALMYVLNSVGVQILIWALTVILTVFYSEKTVEELIAWPQARLSRFKGLQLLPKINLQKLLEKKEKPALSEEEKKKFIPLIPLAPTPNEEGEEESSLDRALNLDLPQKDSGMFTANEKQREPQRRKVIMKTRIVRKIENWELPKLSLLEDPPATRFKVEEKELRKKAELLANKLAQFSVTGDVVAVKPGPAVTMIEFKPSANVRLSKITELADDLALALSSESLRIIAPIPGRDVVGIETSNTQRESVYLKDILADELFWKEDVKLPIALGKQVNGDPQVVDLRKMPHLMIAGTTGSGKSVFTVSAITGLLFKHSPKTLKIVLIDPKQVDLVAFEKIPHLAMPPVTNTKQAVIALKWAVREMEKRYRSMNKFGARKLEDYNEAVAKLTKDKIEEHDKINSDLELLNKKQDTYYSAQLPYIVIVVEEFGDLMSVDKNNVESTVVRLAQMARACGIHLILAMQSPRKEVVTGLIKTNIPGRISFKVNSSMDSRIILDEGGAERLLAQGDMLYKSPGGSNLIRHHGPYLKDAEILSVAQFWSDQAEPEFDASAMRALEGQKDASLDGGSGGFDDDSGFAEEHDEKYDEILAWASTQKSVSASLIQRRFQLGYPRAARLVEVMEKEGVVGPANGSKPRQVLINNLNNLME